MNSQPLRLLILAIAFASLLPSVAGAQQYNVAAFCSNIIGPTVLGGGTGSTTVNAANSMIGLSLLIMLVMLNIAALAYLLGSGFRISNLATFGKTEIGEVVVTALVVFIFIGSFLAVNTLPPTNNYLALDSGLLNKGIFQSDCINLAGGSLTAVGEIAPLYGLSDLVAFESSVKYQFSVSGEGYSASPLSGLSVSVALLGNLATILFVLIALPLAGAVILGIFYAISPLFLYLGIILRTVPFTRAAGGALLGFFIAFYVIFPLLIYLLISQVTVAPVTVNVTPGGQLFNNLSPSDLLAPPYFEFGFGITKLIISAAMAELLYVIFAFVFSLVIAFDFMEAAGDLLGAPSLSSSQALKNLI